MKIHHYTKAQVLPLILRHKTLRFTRADKLDDPSEVPFSDARLDARFYFLSSWSCASEEQSGQWHRYADESRGIRISLNDSPFRWSNIDISISRKTIEISTSSTGETIRVERPPTGLRVDNIECPYGINAMMGNGYILCPDSADLRKEFGGKVTYVMDPLGEARKYASSGPHSTTIFGCGTRIARIKSAGWSDQSEYRFVLYAISGPEIDFSGSSRGYREALCDQFERMQGEGHRPPNVDFVDLPIDEAAFTKMTVTLGPKISAKDRDMVVAAMQKFAPKASIVESSLNVR